MIEGLNTGVSAGYRVASGTENVSYEVANNSAGSGLTNSSAGSGLANGGLANDSAGSRLTNGGAGWRLANGGAGSGVANIDGRDIVIIRIIIAINKLCALGLLGGSGCVLILV